MTERMKIFTYPDAVLKATAEPVQNINEEIRNLVDNMCETMYSAMGIGLAANQVGELKRILVYDVNQMEAGPNPAVLINPEIVLTEGDTIQEESCLSVIDYSADVPRKEKIKVRGVDKDGNPVDIEADGLLARCLQHEIDHLNGVLFIDHISTLKRSLYNKKLKKMMKRADFSKDR
jgi:peptide deformylase